MMDVVERLRERRVPDLWAERSLDEVMATLALPRSERVDPRSLNNNWYFPLDGDLAGWEERVTVWTEPAHAPTSIRVQHLLVAPHTHAVEKGWVVGVKEVLGAWSDRLALELGAKGTKVGSTVHFARADRPTLVVGRGRLAASKVWHVVSTEVKLVPVPLR